VFPAVGATLESLRAVTDGPGMQWGSTGSVDMQEYEVMISPTILQGAALFWSFLDLSRSGEVSRQDIRRRIRLGWLTSIGYDGEILVTPKDRLKN